MKRNNTAACAQVAPQFKRTNGVGVLEAWLASTSMTFCKGGVYCVATMTTVPRVVLNLGAGRT